jgi:hypothetical protein
MQKADKFRSDIDEWVRRSSKEPDELKLESLRRLFYRSLHGLPEELLAGTFLNFRDKYLDGKNCGAERALEWLGAVASLYLGEYDGTKFSREDWRDIRESVSSEAGEIDIELLTRIMELVMENGGLD